MALTRIKNTALLLCGLLAAAPGIAQSHLRLPYARDTIPAGRNLHIPAPFIQSFVTAVPKDYYTKNLPFFCRQELHMQQAHIPVTFRLGSMEQCNQLEQKPGYR